MSNTVNVELRKLFAPHVDSFDFFLDEGLSQAILLSPKTYATSAQGEVLEMWFSDPIIGSPIKHGLDQSSRILYPRECRESKITYSSSITITINARFNDVDILRVEKRICTIPIMVMSKKCRLKGLNSDELVQLGEEMNECGGYFIINGLEKLIRMIIIPRRNYPLAYQRNKFIQKGRNFTNFAVQMRCVREDQSSSTIVMHYLVDGTVRLRFKLRRQDFFLPVVLAMRAFADVTDKQIFDDVSQGEVGNSFILSCLEVILMQCHENKCFTKRESLAYIGKLFRAQ
ncbi:MAG: putative DNA-directed RNA polymerase I subunit RPA2, partial [Streblomastix strix]